MLNCTLNRLIFDDVAGLVVMIVGNLERRERRNRVHFELECESIIERELELRVGRRTACCEAQS